MAVFVRYQWLSQHSQAALIRGSCTISADKTTMSCAGNGTYGGVSEESCVLVLIVSMAEHQSSATLLMPFESHHSTAATSSTGIIKLISNHVSVECCSSATCLTVTCRIASQDRHNYCRSRSVSTLQLLSAPRLVAVP